MNRAYGKIGETVFSKYMENLKGLENSPRNFRDDYEKPSKPISFEGVDGNE